MRHRILLLFAVAAVFGSCTTMYKSGQTPDDVYYSPGREIPPVVQTNENTESTQRYNGNEEYSDYYLRMKAYNRNRWSAFDNDYMYWNDWRWNNQMYFNTYNPGFNYGVGFGTGWNSGLSWAMGWNYGMPYHGYGWCSPFTPGYYGTPIIVVNPKVYNPKAYAPRNGNLGSYNTAINNYSIDPKTGSRTYNISTPNRAPIRSFSSGSRSRGLMSDIFNGSSNSSGSPRGSSGSSSSPARSSGTSGGFHGGGGGGGAPVRSFPRGGGGQ